MLTRKKHLKNTVDRLYARSTTMGRRLLKECTCGCFGESCTRCREFNRVRDLALEGARLRKKRRVPQADIDQFLRKAYRVLDAV